MPSTLRSERINMRVSPEALEIIRDASECSNQDVTSFVLSSALASARRVLFEEKLLALEPAEIAQINAALAAEDDENESFSAMVSRVRQRAAQM